VNAQTPWWVPVVAAFGASIITILGLQWQRWRDNRANARASKLAAYSELHARIFAFVRRVGTLGLAKQLSSGIGEGIAVTLGQRKPADVFELHEWIEADFRAISDAYSKVCLIGSQDAIDLAGKLLASCSDLIGSATVTDPQRGGFTRLIKGEVQTPEQAQAFEAVRTRVFKEREEFASLVRQELGHKPVVFPLQRAASRATEPDKAEQLS
jgi:hypothetical protein